MHLYMAPVVGVREIEYHHIIAPYLSEARNTVNLCLLQIERLVQIKETPQAASIPTQNLLP